MQVVRQGNNCYIHPSVRLGTGVRLGHGVVIEENCEIGDNCFIGNYTVLRPQTIIGKQTIIAHLISCEGWCHIGDQCEINSNSHLTKGIYIENKVFVGPGVITTNDRRMAWLRGDWVMEPPRFMYGSRIGSGSIILPGVVIGRNAVIGAGSVVTESIPNEWVAYGNPAKLIRLTKTEEVI